MTKAVSILVLISTLFIFISCDNSTEDKTTNLDEDAKNETIEEEKIVDGNESLDETEMTDENNSTTPCSDYATEFPLKEGDCVPDFTLPAQDGTSITLSDFQGMYVVFSSFPAVNTPVCSGQMQKLDSMYDEFITNNIQPFGFNNQPPDYKDDWCETLGVTKLLILSDHDPKDEVSKMFGVNGFSTKRANTIIGPDGRFVTMMPSSGAADIPGLIDYVNGLE